MDKCLVSLEILTKVLSLPPSANLVNINSDGFGTKKSSSRVFFSDDPQRATVHRHASSVICTWFGLRKVAWIKEIAANFENVALADQREDRLGRFFYPASAT
jgi:hypothetical protein